MLNYFRSWYVYMRSVRVGAGGAGSSGITLTRGEKFFKRMGWRGGCRMLHGWRTFQVAVGFVLHCLEQRFIACMLIRTIRFHHSAFLYYLFFFQFLQLQSSVFVWSSSLSYSVFVTILITEEVFRRQCFCWELRDMKVRDSCSASSFLPIGLSFEQRGLSEDSHLHLQTANILALLLLGINEHTSWRQAETEGL